MEEVRMQELLLADEDKLKNTLRANASIEKSRDLSEEALSEELGSLLLRYNAACAPDRMRQALAEGLTATAREALTLMKAGGAELERERRESSPWAPLLLLAAVVLAFVGVFVMEKLRLVGFVCLAAAIIGAFAAGRIWLREREVRARASVDPDALWNAMKRSCETMDRKIEEFCAQAQDWAAEERERATDGAPLNPEALELYGELLEALYADSGELALRRLKKLPGYLRQRGVETEDYTGDNAEHFELFPSKRDGATQRPALVAGSRLLLPGRATERAD